MNRNDLQDINLIRIRSVMSRTGISRSQIYNLAKQGKFPASVPLTPDGSSVAWVKTEVDSWINERIAARGEA